MMENKPKLNGEGPCLHGKPALMIHEFFSRKLSHGSPFATVERAEGFRGRGA